MEWPVLIQMRGANVPCTVWEPNFHRFRRHGLASKFSLNLVCLYSQFHCEHHPDLNLSYGERGLLHIYRALDDLFPLLDQEHTFSPLDHKAFMTHVLVPEAACLLIQDDLQISSHAEALALLLRSQKYGQAMFPDRGEDDGIELKRSDVGMRVRLELGRKHMRAGLSQAQREVEEERSVMLRSRFC
jgi:hypothetical protein